MSPDEVIEKLTTIGVVITRPTLLRYEKDGLIPEPRRGALGRGAGRWTDYPEKTVAEAYAAWTMMHGTYGFKSLNKTLFQGKPPKLAPPLIAIGRELYYDRLKTNEEAEKYRANVEPDEYEKENDETVKLVESNLSMDSFIDDAAELNDMENFMSKAYAHYSQIFWGYSHFIKGTWEWQRDQGEAMLKQLFDNQHDSREVVLRVQNELVREEVPGTGGSIIHLRKTKPE